MATAAYNFGDEYWRGKFPPTPDPALTQQAREWLKNRAAARAGLGAAPAVPAVPVAPVAPAAMPAAVKVGQMAGKGVGWGLRRLLPSVALADMGFGMADKANEIANDPNSRSLTERTLQVLSGADVTGLGAKIGSWLTSDSASAPAPVAAVAPAAAPVAAPIVAGPRQLPRDELKAAILSGNFGAFQPGTGGIIRNSTGEVTQIGSGVVDAPVPMLSAREYDAARGALPPSSDTYTRPVNSAIRSSPQAEFFGATAKQRQIAQDNANRVASATLGAKTGLEIAKLRQDAALKGPGAAKDTMEAQGMADLQRLAAAEPDPMKRASILAKRNLVPETMFTVPQTAMPDAKTGAMPVLQTRGPGAGGMQLVTPTQPITMAQAVASAKANKTYKSDVQVRADMATKPGFRLID